jgi:hypothetical protein
MIIFFIFPSSIAVWIFISLTEYRRHILLHLIFIIQLFMLIKFKVKHFLRYTKIILLQYK